MSNPSSPYKPTKKRHVIMHHAKQPHGIASIALILFVMAWAAWTFMVW